MASGTTSFVDPTPTEERPLVVPLIGMDIVFSKMVKRLLEAKKTVYFFMWCCDFTTPICKGKNLDYWMRLACERNPKLQIRALINDNKYNKYVDEKHRYHHHRQIQVTLVPMFNNTSGARLLAWLQNAPESKGCDVRDLYNGCYPYKPNTKGWHWFDLTLYIQPPSAVMVKFLHEAYSSQGAILRKKDEDKIPFPFINQFSHPHREEEMYVRLIRGAQKYICISNQYFYSSGYSANIIGNELTARVRRAMEERDDTFRVFLVVNWTMKDESSKFSKWGLKGAVCASFLNLKLNLLQSTLSGEDWTRMVFVGYLQHPVNNTKVYVHEKRIIVDGHSMIVSSSNLCDRSMAMEDSDTELGYVVLDNPETVERVQQACWQAHTRQTGPMGADGPAWTYLSLFEYIAKEQRERLQRKLKRASQRLMKKPKPPTEAQIAAATTAESATAAASAAVVEAPGASSRTLESVVGEEDDDSDKDSDDEVDDGYIDSEDDMSGTASIPQSPTSSTAAAVTATMTSYRSLDPKLPSTFALLAATHEILNSFGKYI